MVQKAGRKTAPAAFGDTKIQHSSCRKSNPVSIHFTELPRSVAYDEDKVPRFVAYGKDKQQMWLENHFAVKTVAWNKPEQRNTAMKSNFTD